MDISWICTCVCRFVLALIFIGFVFVFDHIRLQFWTDIRVDTQFITFEYRLRTYPEWPDLIAKKDKMKKWLRHEDFIYYDDITYHTGVGLCLAKFKIIFFRFRSWQRHLCSRILSFCIYPTPRIRDSSSSCCSVTEKSPARLTHYPTTNTLSNG